MGSARQKPLLLVKLQLANTRDVEDGFPQGAGATMGGRWLLKKGNRG